VSKVTDIISKELEVNMKSVSFSAKDGTFVGNLVLEVDSTEHLDSLLSKIRAIDDHIRVERTDLERV